MVNKESVTNWKKVNRSMKDETNLGKDCLSKNRNSSVDLPSKLYSPAIKLESCNDPMTADSKMIEDSDENKQKRAVQFKLRLPKVEFSSRSINLEDTDENPGKVSRV